MNNGNCNSCCTSYRSASPGIPVSRSLRDVGSRRLLGCLLFGRKVLLQKVTTISFDDICQAKHDLISLGLPAKLAIDFGPTFRPEYLNFAAKNGADKALAIDAHIPDLDPGIDFHQADFGNDSIVEWITNYRLEKPGECLGVTFDTLLHQYAPIHVLRNILGIVDKISVGTPVLKESKDSCKFLPALPEEDQEQLFPANWMCQELTTEKAGRFVAKEKYTWAHWLWGLSPTLLKIWIEREGFEIKEERLLERPRAWNWWGCYATKTTRDVPS